MTRGDRRTTTIGKEERDIQSLHTQQIGKAAVERKELMEGQIYRKIEQKALKGSGK